MRIPTLSISRIIGRKFAWHLIGNGGYTLSLFVILIVIAKQGGPELVGIYGLALALVAPIYLFFNFQLRQLLATSGRQPPGEIGGHNYLATRVVCALCALIGSLLPAYFIWPEFILVVILVSLSKFVESLSDICYGEMQKRDQSGRVGISQGLHGFANVIAFLVGMHYSKYGLSTSLALQCLIRFAILCSVDLPIFSLRGVGEFLSQRLSAMFVPLTVLVHGLRLGLVSLLFALMEYLPIWFLGYFASPYLLGIYSTFVYLQRPGSMVTLTLGQALAAQLGELWTAGNMVKFRRVAIISTLFVLLVGSLSFLIFYLYGDWIVRFLFSEAYVEHLSVALLLLFSMIFGFAAINLMNVASAARITKYQPWIVLVSISFILTGVIFILAFELEYLENLASLQILARIAALILTVWMLRSVLLSTGSSRSEDNTT